MEINLSDSDYIGMPFLFKVGEDWWKDNGGDYYVTLKAPDLKKVKVTSRTIAYLTRFGTHEMLRSCISVLGHFQPRSM